MVWIGSGSERRNESAKNTITIVPKYSLGPQYLSSSLVWLDPILNMLLLVHMSILTNQGGNLPYRSPLSLLGHSKCSFMCSNTIFQCDWTGWKMTQNVGWGKFCAKRASEIVVPPKEMLLSFSCVRFLTNYDVRERKQHIDLTILCVLKTNFWTAIK